MMHARKIGRFSLFASLIILGVTAGCDNSVESFIESDRYFTIFGYLDTAADTQFVRVTPFRRDIGGSGDEQIDAMVTSTELESGVVQEWRDSVITFDDGSLGHVFFAEFRPIPGRTYRFDVQSSDGDAAWAETIVPPVEDVEVTLPPVFATPPLSHVVTWRDIEAAPFRVEVWYRFSEFPPTQPFKEFVITYDDIGSRVDETDWQVRVNLSRDIEEIRPRLRPGSPLLGVGMRLTMSDDAWRPPGGTFNPDILVQPGTFSNVEHGFGFFGSVNQYTVEWVLDPELLAKLQIGAPR